MAAVNARLREWTAFLVALGGVLTAALSLLECAAEKREMQAAVQALAEVAFR